MISVAHWLAWPGFEAFFVSAERGPCYLIQVDRREMARRLAEGESLTSIVTGEPSCTR